MTSNASTLEVWILVAYLQCGHLLGMCMAMVVLQTDGQMCWISVFLLTHLCADAL